MGDEGELRSRHQDRVADAVRGRCFLTSLLFISLPPLFFHPFSAPHDPLPPSLSPLLLSPRAMALHSASSIARLHHTNVHSDLVPSIFASGSGNLLVDFAGLCSKSKRARRRLGAFTSRKAFQHYLTKNSSPVKAVLDLERRCKPLDDSATSDPKPQVRIPLIVLRLPALFFFLLSFNSSLFYRCYRTSSVLNSRCYGADISSSFFHQTFSSVNSYTLLRQINPSCILEKSLFLKRRP